MSLSRRQIERTCASCFKKFPQKELLAVRRLKDGSVLVDLEQKFSGRSVYICRQKICFLKATRRKDKNAFEYGLHIKIPVKVLEELASLFATNHAPNSSKSKRTQ